MYKDVLRSIQDIGIFPVISFVFFFAFFILMVIWVMMYKKEEVNELSSLPFESSTSPKDPKSNEIDLP